MAKKKAVKGQIILSPDKMDARTRLKAMTEHGKIMAEVKTAKNSFLVLADRLAKMQQSELWRGVITDDRKNGFSDWDAYRTYVLGTMGKTKFYELIAVHQLTKGDHPLAESTITQMGVKRAYEVSRLPVNKRTPAIITAAQTKPLAEVKEKVQRALNEDLPKDRQKEPTQSFVRSMPPSIVARYEALEARAVWIDGLGNDQDETLTAKQKVFAALIINFEENYVEELEEADKRRKEFELAKKSETKK